MASLDLDAILQDLNCRFAVPLPEFYKRRIIFWYDEDREFEDLLDGLRLDNATVVTLTGSNTFAVKKQLCEDDTATNFLVYSPLSFQTEDDNWLINMQLYSEEFRADLISIWLNEMGLPITPVLRKQLKVYQKFFKLKDRRSKVAALSDELDTVIQVPLAVMAVLSRSDMQLDNIIRAVICAGLDMDTNSVYQSFITYGAQNAFWVMVAQATGYHESEDANLGRLAIHILLTAATRTMYLDSLAGLDAFLSVPHQAYCYDFISAWLHSDDNMQLYEVAQFVENEARLYQRFRKLAVVDLVNTACFPCIDVCILIALMSEISDHLIQIDTIQSTVEKRRTMVWYDSVSCYYEGILQVANMQAFFLEHAEGFHTVEPAKVWQEYTSDYYHMDTYYRQFHRCFRSSLTMSNPLLDDLFKHVADKVEGLYTHWFIGQLGTNWSDACAENLGKYGRILEVPQQTEFYRARVKNSGTRVFVIISDALRYEVAASLAEQLRRETQSKVELNSCQAIFPSVTKFGMAALLPHQRLSVIEKTNGLLGVLADGQSTEAGNRDKVLKSAHEASTALKYDAIIGLKRAERQALVKGMDIIYLYHDKVDGASHISEHSVFPACEDAIAELKNLVRIIVNEFGGTNVVITADHGFLYTDSPLSEDDKVDKTTPNEQDVEIDRRYLITQKGSKPEYLLPVKFMDGEYDAFAPRESVRIKKKGGGLNFVHGGISLQELVVPVVEYQFLRSSTKAYQQNREKIDTKPVTVSLLSASRKVSNMIFSLNFYQKEVLGSNREAAVYLLYFTDANGKQISDTCKIFADKTSENSQDRTFRCSFHLRTQHYSNLALYYLVIAEESGRKGYQREEFQIDVASLDNDALFLG